MRYTIFDTPVLSFVLQRFSLLIFRIFGWRVVGELPDIPKFVAITNHTSNWDLPIAVFYAFTLKAKISTLGKDSLFRWPFAPFFEWLGCISTDRSKSTNLVERMIDAFNESKKLILVVAPEGTRQKVRYWRSGFYYIAAGARVPIVLGFIDYRRKVAGIGSMITPTGDIDADMKIIQSFYANITGRFQDKPGKVEIKRKERSVGQ